LLPRLKLLPLRQKLLDLFASFRVVFWVVQNSREKSLYHFNSRCHEGLILGNGHFAFHEGKEAVFGKSGENESGLSFTEHLH
jgi:hypothetical protein